MVDEPTGGEGHEDHADAEEDGGGELQGEGEEPGGFFLPTAGTADEVLSSWLALAQVVFGPVHLQCHSRSRKRS
jgi:hypothetical protein